MTTGSSPHPPPLRRQSLGLACWILLCFLAPALGASSTPDAWYASLHKPSWNPPGWVFGPVWTLLYTMMAVAAWLVWRQGGWRRRLRPLSWFLVQLAFNAAWTPLFFGLQRPGLAFVDILLLWLAVVATLASFRRVHRGAAWLLVPYLVWITFAAVLNFTLWRMNP